MAKQSSDFTLSFRRLADIDTNEQQWLVLFKEPHEAKAWLERYKGRRDQDNLSSAERQTMMNSINPLYTLRTYMAQESIDDEENGSAEVLDFLVQVLQNPFIEHADAERYAEPSPIDKQNMALSCSS